MHTHCPGLCPTSRQSTSPPGRPLPWPGVGTRSQEKSTGRLPAHWASPRAGGWRRRGSPCVGTSLRITVAAGVACPLYPHEKAGGGLRLFSTFSQVISRIRRAAGTSLPLAFIVSVPLRVATEIAPIQRWRLTLLSAPGPTTVPVESPRTVEPSRSEGTLPWQVPRPRRPRELEALSFRPRRADLPHKG